MSKPLTVIHFNTPIGVFEVAHDEQSIYSSHFIHWKQADDYRQINEQLPVKQKAGKQSRLSRQLENELNAYFQNPNHRFQLKLSPQGTPYQQAVWNSLLVIPSGRTMTYGELANRLKSSPRAIGQACKKNPLAVFIPCHRIVSKTHIGGYMGNPEAKDCKLALLKHEGNRL